LIYADRRRFLFIALSAALLWSQDRADGANPRFPDLARRPFVVVYSLAPGAAIKAGVQALTDTGAQIFASSNLNERNSGRSAFGGSVPFPRTVRVTWREGVTTGEYWTTGTVVFDRTIQVAERIPTNVFHLAKGSKRFIKLQFRIKDDAVLLAWSVDERRQGGYVELMHDGDFRDPTMYNGIMVDPGWEK
jgi:hypothetical protein